MTILVTPTVLIADDNHDAADSLAIALSLFGCETLTAYDGLDCLALAHSSQPDVIILDLNMPGMDGLDAATHLRLLSPKPYLIALTGDARAELPRRTREVGFAAHLVKPIDPDVLATQIGILVHTGVFPKDVSMHQRGLPATDAHRGVGVPPSQTSCRCDALG